MRVAVLLLALLTALATIPAPALAVTPDEMLADPVLEARARALSRDLRCVLCRNQSIDDSNADIAKVMRVVLRERLLAGDTDAEAIAFLVDRYGTFVLLKPPFAPMTYLLWGGPLILLLAAIYMSSRLWRGTGDSAGRESEGLSKEDHDLVTALLDGKEPR